MKRLVTGLLAGIVVGTLAQAQEPADVKVLRELPMETIRGTSFTLPKEYGRLVDVIVDSEVHYLYLEDRSGVIRVILIGPRGAVQRSRNPLQLLSPDVYVVKREREAS